MFVELLRSLIERHCAELRHEIAEIGKTLALCDPYHGAVGPGDLAGLRDACCEVRGRGSAIGLPEVGATAATLETALDEIEARPSVEPWDLVRLMSLQGRLAAAVDEIEPEAAALYAGLTSPEALAVMPATPAARFRRSG